MTTAARDFLALGTVRWMLRDVDDRDGALRRARPREPDARASRRGSRLANRRLGQCGQSAAGSVRGVDPGPRAVLPGRRLSDRSLPARPGDARGSARRPARNVRSPSRSSSRRRRSRTRRCTIRNAWPRCGRRSATAGPTWPAGRTPRPKTRSCRSSRSSGSSGEEDEVYRLHLDDRNVETYARRRFGLYTRSSRRSRSDLDFDTRSTMGFDAGRFPIPAETKRLWESPDGSSLESLLRPPTGRRPAVAGLASPLADGGDDEGRPRRRASAGALARAGRSLVSRPAPGRQLFARAGAMDHAQRLFPPDRPPLRDDPPRARPVPDAVPGAGRGETRARADRPAGPSPSTAGAVRGDSDDRGAGPRDRVVRGRRRDGARGDRRMLPALEEIESLIETGRHDEAATALGRARDQSGRRLWRRSIVGTSAAGATDAARRPSTRLPGDQPARTFRDERR